MSETLELAAPAPNLFGAPSPQELFAAVGDPRGRGPRRAGEDRRPDRPHPAARRQVGHPGRGRPTSPSSSCTTSTSRPATALPAGNLLDLGLIYGDGPKHDAFCYQVPGEAGAGRHLLRIGRARPTATSPAWGAARDLPRTSCPNLDTRPVETRTEVLVPNTLLRLEPAARRRCRCSGR